MKQKFGPYRPVMNDPADLHWLQKNRKICTIQILILKLQQSCCKEFAVEGFYKQKPVLYTTSQFYKDYLEQTVFSDYPIWIRSVFHQPDPGFQWVIWQYADNVRVPGIETPVDMNAAIRLPH